MIRFGVAGLLKTELHWAQVAQVLEPERVRNDSANQLTPASLDSCSRSRRGAEVRS